MLQLGTFFNVVDILHCWNPELTSWTSSLGERRLGHNLLTWCQSSFNVSSLSVSTDMSLHITHTAGYTLCPQISGTFCWFISHPSEVGQVFLFTTIKLKSSLMASWWCEAATEWLNEKQKAYSVGKRWPRCYEYNLYNLALHTFDDYINHEQVRNICVVFIIVLRVIWMKS